MKMNMGFVIFVAMSLALFTIFAPPTATKAASPAMTAVITQAVPAQIGDTWTYAQVTAATDEIAVIINSNRKRLAQAKQDIDVADAELGGLGAAYGSVGTAINTAVSAHPTNAAYLALDAAWDELVSEFQALKAESAAQKAALEAL
jgi:hypothetical protein